MSNRKGGFRRKTRYKLRKKPAEKGKLSIRKYFQKFKVGESVCFHADPAYQDGMYLPRFHGRVGVIKGKSGDCYKIVFNDKNKEKTIIVHPVHLKRV